MSSVDGTSHLDEVAGELERLQGTWKQIGYERDGVTEPLDERGWGAVAPVVHEGVRYEAPHFSNPCGQNGGCIVASDAASGAPLWNLKVYCTHYDPRLETDVQDVFITSVTLDKGRLALTNEKNLRFAIDPSARSVTGDARGCEDAMNGGCAYASASRPTSLLALSCMLGALVLARRRRS